MKRLPFLICLAASSAHAEEFSARVEAGKKALVTPEAQEYQRSWGPTIHASISVCVPVGSTAPANLGTFTFVADVDQSGRVSSVDVDPSTIVSRCFSQHFAGAQLPAPPKELNVGTMFPITESVSIAP